MLCEEGHRSQFLGPRVGFPGIAIPGLSCVLSLVFYFFFPASSYFLLPTNYYLLLLTGPPPARRRVAG
jgi:hypothetical protein